MPGRRPQDWKHGKGESMPVRQKHVYLCLTSHINACVGSASLITLCDPALLRAGLLALLELG